VNKLYQNEAPASTSPASASGATSGTFGVTVRQSLDVLAGTGTVVELRIPNSPKGTISGYFDNLDQLARAAEEWNGRTPGIYMTLNPVDPNLLARSANRLTQYAKHTTSDADILRRSWLPIDLDSVRPSGISATDEEHRLALARAEEIRAWLGEQGWPDPISADSGNGAHLLCRIELPNDDQSRELINKCLEALDWLFSDEKVKVDPTTSNAARIWKVYGTLACKGDSLPDRPHRLAKLLRVPDGLEAVSLELLSKLAGLVPQSPQDHKGKTEVSENFDLDDWIKAHNIAVVSIGPWKGGRRYILQPCPWNPSHINRSAYIVQFPNGAIAAGCHHDSCGDKGWHDLRDQVEPGWRDASDDTDAISPNDSPKENQSKTLVNLASEADLFHTAEGDVGYATFRVNGHQETWAIKSKTFKQWLSHRYYLLKGKPPAAQPLKDAIALLDARAQFEGRQQQVFIRIARADGSIYVDLANREWEAVEISSNGWQIVKDPPVKFRRARGMLTLPYPTRGGNIEDLFQFVNIEAGRDRTLLIGAILQYFRPDGPYVIVVFHGGQGSAKSTTAKILKSIVDPNTAPLRSASKDERDIMIAASNGWILAYDNVSHLPTWLSDILCTLATGGGYGTRELYTDMDEVLFSVQRPVVINGIEEFATRADFLDRAIILYLPQIPEGKRRDEKRFWRDFEDAAAGILGALLDAVCCAVRGEDAVELAAMPRMADFVRWVTAAEPALGWKPGTFVRAYKANTEDANQLALEASPVAAEIFRFVESMTGEWKGSAKDLLEALSANAALETIKQRSWPKSPNWLSNILRRLQPNLEKAGVKVEFGREVGHRRGRWISISKMPEKYRPDRPYRPSRTESAETAPEDDFFDDSYSEDGIAEASGSNGRAPASVTSGRNQNHLPFETDWIPDPSKGRFEGGLEFCTGPACRVCGERERWRGGEKGPWICTVCHPPAQ